MTRAQAALEFLMTYGWAILVVLAAIAALVYFGVFSPERFLPESCTIAAGLACTDFKITGNAVQLYIQNGMGEAVNISRIALDHPACTGSASAYILDGGSHTFIIACSGLSGKFKSGIIVEYRTESGQFSHTKTGKIAAKVES